MDQAGIIRELLIWLESHLDQPLALDNVAHKAGYSKWHLQRMFKHITGHAIGAYIRARRLSKAAVALRLTGRPVLDIALQYRFDSQQTFTRAFKKQFNQTPASYRRAEDWNTYGLRPPIRLGEFSMPQPKMVKLPTLNLVGQTQHYACNLEQISTYRAAMRGHFWSQFFQNSEQLPPLIYGLHQVRSSVEKEDEQEVFYTTAVAEGELVQLQPTVHAIQVTSGNYVEFTYQGPREGLQDFILVLYSTCMPTLNLIRRAGEDIERIYLPEGRNSSEIRCEYLIPIRHAS